MKQQLGAPAPILTDDPSWLKGDGVVRGHAVVTILKPAREIYDFLRDVEHAPQWMERITRVVKTGDTTSTWTMQVDEDKQISWNSEVVSDVPGEKIAWRSVDVPASKSGENDDRFSEAGEVVFYDRGPERGTEVTLVNEIRIPGGKLANAFHAASSRSPRQGFVENLRHLKALLETGELPSVQGQPHGPRGISGGIKEFLYGENNPEPVGTKAEAPKPDQRRKQQESTATGQPDEAADRERDVA